MSYRRDPSYPVVGGEVATGYDPLAAALEPGVVAIDGPAALPWERFVDRLVQAAPIRCEAVDVRRFLAPRAEIERRTARATIVGDPVFGRVFDGSLSDLFDELPRPPAPGDGEVVLLFGPGSALLAHDVLWYADVPKRLALAAVRAGAAANIGGGSSEQRLLFVDWPLLDRHKQALVGRIDQYVDLTDVEAPRSLAGDTLRASLRALARAPFRARPAFHPGAWGGQWIRRTLRIATEAPNLAWSYELITPESGVLLDGLEVGFELLMAQEGERILGPHVAERFGLSFPIRFDYLDTLDGGNLSIQCHPSEEYMRETFGLPYTQHETYYVMVAGEDSRIFLGLREDADLGAFRAEAERAEQAAVAFDPEQYLLTFRAQQHQLYLIPGGTPHASGAGNVVLEISATPYLYTLRFYDWLRRDLDGALRPVHLEHAFANLDPRRRGAAVARDLIQIPRIVNSDNRAVELDLGRLPELFFAVRRLDFADEVTDDTAGRFHVLNLTAGEEVAIETEAGDTHPLAYAETIVVPAAVGPYRIRRVRGGECKVVKALVA